MSDFDPDEWEYDYDENGACTMCGGDGYVECWDPIQCCLPHTRDGYCPCGACNGSGLAKDQTIW